MAGTTKQIGMKKSGTLTRVVVVDDEFAHRRVMTQILKSTGFEVVAEGESGEDAVIFAKMHRPEIIFMDYHMPRMDGLAALKKILAEVPGIKVVIFTTEVHRKSVLEIIEAGAADYITKPLERAVVMEKLTALMVQPPVSRATP